MRSLHRLVLVGSLLLLLTSSCSKKIEILSDGERRAFDGASPELKQAWETALAAEKTNAYAVVQIVLNELAGSDLSPPQREALKKELTAVNQRFSAALDKGDPVAQQALQELRQAPPNRPRR